MTPPAASRNVYCVLFGANDTDPRAERVQIELLREASPARRAELLRSVSRTVIDLSRAALRRAMPGASETELSISWVRLHYGEELAERLTRYLAARAASQ